MGSVRRPKRLNCHGMHWKIKFVSGLDGCLGKTCSAELTIYVSKDMDIQSQRTVLAHEIGHAVWWSYTLNPPVKYPKVAAGEATELEEYIVSAYTPAFITTMYDNAEVFAFIFGITFDDDVHTEVVDDEPAKFIGFSSAGLDEEDYE